MNSSEIMALARMLDRVDYYRLLKVDRGSSIADIRAAYYEARKRFHPDNYLSAEDDIRKAVDQIARRITECYMVLRDHRKRSAYDRALVDGALRYSAEVEEAARSDDAAREGTTPNGKKFYSMAQEAEAGGDVPKAVSHLKMALTFEPKNEWFKQELERLAPPKKKKKAAKPEGDPKA